MNNNRNLIKLFGTILLLTLILGLLGCTNPPSNENAFQSIEGNSICKLEGKPIIRMYSTNICPHCIWVEPAFDSVIKKYVDQNKIIAHHWEWIINSNGELIGVDDKLTSAIETSMPTSEDAIFKEFSPNTFVPAFIFGCKYYRIGNQFETQKDLNAEKAEFERIIEELLKE
jgi:thiol-disulfide isomerase/thioredoxin